jgi:hypothetical protein
MGDLVRRISGLSAIGYGINIFEVQPVGAVSGVSSNVVGVVAMLPWGPHPLTTITSVAELLETYYPAAFGDRDSAAWPALRAFLNKSFPGGLRIVRPEVTSSAKATLTFDDVDSADSVTVTAAHKGALGNSINVAWEANADDATARDAIVTVGSTYSERYENVATIVDSALVITDPGDPLVSFTKAASATKVPDAITATALASGADGTAVAADFTGSSDGKGIEAFEAASADVDIVFVAECPEALIDSINAKLLSYATGTDKGMAVLSTPASQTASAAQTYVASYRDDRLVNTWPKAKTVDWFDADAAEVTVDGNAFVAAAMANVDPELSPGGAGGVEYLKGITGLEDETATAISYDALNAAGVAPLMMSKALGGAIIRRGVTTSLTSGKTKIFRRRMTDYITESLANYAQNYVERPLDLDLPNRVLGVETGAMIGAWSGFLLGLEGAGRIRDFAIDAFSGNTQTNIDSGRWFVDLSVKLLSMQEETILRANVGESVTITDA